MESYIHNRNDQKHHRGGNSRGTFTCNSEWEFDIMNACKDLYTINRMYGIENMDPNGSQYRCQFKIDTKLELMTKKNPDLTHSPEMVEYILRHYPALLAVLVTDYQRR